jgi:Na+/citrate or Na+/malate symporter
MILVILAAIMAYRKALATERNGWKWAGITSGAFIATQLVIQFGGGVLLGLGIAFAGWSENVLDTYNIIITIISVIASFIVMWLILRYLDKVPEEQVFTPPPPPPNFN